MWASFSSRRLVWRSWRFASDVLLVVVVAWGALVGGLSLVGLDMVGLEIVWLLVVVQKFGLFGCGPREFFVRAMLGVVGGYRLNVSRVEGIGG